jgi:hypothetical protein
MTLQELYFADMKDLQAIRLTCTECRASLSIPPVEPVEVPRDCPFCTKPWFAHDSLDVQHLRNFMRSIDALRQRIKSVRCDIHIELPSQREAKT